MTRAFSALALLVLVAALLPSSTSALPADQRPQKRNHHPFDEEFDTYFDPHYDGEYSIQMYGNDITGVDPCTGELEFDPEFQSKMIAHKWVDGIPVYK